MSGIKGQKWGIEKRSPLKQKINFQVTLFEYNQIKKIAEKKEWSVSKVIHDILVGKIEPILERSDNNSDTAMQDKPASSKSYSPFEDSIEYHESIGS